MMNSLSLSLGSAPGLPGSRRSGCCLRFGGAPSPHPPQLPRCTTHYERRVEIAHRPSGKKKFKAVTPSINLSIDLGKQKTDGIGPVRFKP